jgi:hypothetical protein
MIPDWWAASVKMLGDPNFLQGLYDFDRENIQDKTIKKLKPFIEMP